MHVIRHHGSEDNTFGLDDCKAHGPLLSRWRTWRALEIVCLVWTIGYFTTWYDQYYTSEKLLVTFFCATASMLLEVLVLLGHTLNGG